MRSSRICVPLLALLGFGWVALGWEDTLFGQAVPASEEAALTDDPLVRPLACVIRSEETCELGKVPQIKVAITNRTMADIYLVGSLDASDSQRRYPHCYFEVIGPDGKSAIPEFSGCSFKNTLREQDFVPVRPRKSFDPYQKIDDYGFFSAYQLAPETFRRPGEYRIRFIYSTKNDNIVDWAGDGFRKVAVDEKLLGMFKQVPKVEVRSNEFKVTIVEPGK